MTMEFRSIGEFTTHLLELAVAQHVADKAILGRATALVQKAAKNKIGRYQGPAGPFAPWADLSQATIDDKQKQGFTGQRSDDDPLLRTWELHDSIERNNDAREGYVGSDNDKAVWQELGTKTIPPRSFLGSAAVEKVPEVLDIVGLGTVVYLSGGGVMGGKLPIGDD